MVKFISYTGKIPNLCKGVLTLEIDGEIVTFGDNIDRPIFWKSGGRCYTDGDETIIECENWKIDKDKIPQKYQKYVGEIIKVFCDNVIAGCCGGCL